MSLLDTECDFASGVSDSSGTVPELLCSNACVTPAAAELPESGVLALALGELPTAPSPDALELGFAATAAVLASKSNSSRDLVLTNGGVFAFAFA